MSKGSYVVLVCRMEHYSRYTFNNAQDAMAMYMTETRYCCYVEVGVYTNNGYKIIDRTW